MSENLGDAEAKYMVEHDIQALFDSLQEALMLEKPQHPRQFLAGQLQDFSALHYEDLVQLIQAIHRISSKSDIALAHSQIVEESSKLLHCDRVSLFIHDPSQNCLKLLAGKGAKGIIMQENTGVTWEVFKTSQLINLTDAYSDERFDARFDKQYNYKTNSLLGAPVVDSMGQSIGVLLALNKRSGSFSPKDEELIGHLAIQTGITLRNTQIFKKVTDKEKKCKVLTQLMKYISQDMPAQSLALEMTSHAKDLVGADHCCIFVINHSLEELISVASDSDKNFRLPLNLPSVKRTIQGEVVNLPKCSEEQRLATEFQKYGLEVQSLMMVPIKGVESIIGVTLVVNKHSDSMFGEIPIYSSFEESDSDLLDTFDEIIGKKLEIAFGYIIKAQSDINEPAVHFESSFGKHKTEKELPPNAIRETEEE